MRVPMTPRARAIVAAEGSPSRADASCLTGRSEPPHVFQQRTEGRE